ncbi:Kinesin putativekinesin [Leptomonas pyrrhocoris]|uniref:Kinesin putativekinesin n=1 Tax=Leptomonas pyrrhocoris TaxID=157538 RepID=A0A0N0DVT9_LEPPY|nr:Kinesin putativekinesin [Leptomonas pyrrhocoris]KPA80841.1 Kinesin putativekinesin [Leptomonas pyrrhocoris]|eukprot:XP_015659280.1 Kinesin putativekinesin [Leptomonas pyrrhocoris]
MTQNGEEGIRVYLRIRPPPTSQQSRLLASSDNNAISSSAAGPSPRTCQYEIEDDFHKSIMHLHTTQRLLQEAQRSAAAGGGLAAAAAAAAESPPAPDDVINNSVVDFRYRFDRVFKPTATQEDVFNTVAKDCVASMLAGLNSTVFAYGQTGSGKTYSITGGTDSYQDRGLIPRAMAMIYDAVARRREGGDVNDSYDDAATTFSIAISYLQIYNDKGQDLLNHGHDARTLEELPPVTIHEMEDDIVLRGLEQHSAPTLSDALNLLFLGDTNRLYCETPMNKTSSRSHCVFSVYLEARSATTSTVRRSKLNLVDLAGSERVSKTGVSGTILTEAKHINLSLHFLEQVIVALSEKAKGVRDHVPYRNSFLTMVLRDSLGRNCKTAMLATAHVVASQVAETISTCQFAQRVALIRQAPQVNVETDPVLLVRKLKAEVAQLRDEVAYLRANGGGSGSSTTLAADRALSDDERDICRRMVDAFVQRAAVDGDWGSRLTGFNGDMARMYYCYDVLRERLIKGGVAERSSNGVGGAAPAIAATAAATQAAEQRALLDESEAQVLALRQSLQLKENELQMLLTVLKRAGASGVGGVGGAGGGGSIGARYNAPTQTVTSSSRSSGTSAAEAADDAGDADWRGFQFTGATSPHASDAELRRQIYQAAKQLIYELRQSFRHHRDGTPQENTQQPSPAMSRVAAEAAAQAALTRVTTLAQQGQLTEAEAAAATAFLESKKGLPQPRASDTEQRSSVGGVGGVLAPGSLDDSRSAVDVLMDEQLVQDRAQALETFKATYEAQNKVEETKQLLKPKYASCKATAQQLNACVDAMKHLKTQIQRRRAERAVEGVDAVDSEEANWLEQLRTTKEKYNTYAAELRQAKEEIDGMHVYLKHAQEQLVRDFEKWFTARQQQVQLAVQQQQRHALRGRQEAQQVGLAMELRTVLGAADGTPASPAATKEPSNGSCRSSVTTAKLGESTAPPPIQNNEEALLHEVYRDTARRNHNNIGGSCDDGDGYHTLSATVPSTTAVSRAYPYSAPVNTTAAVAAAGTAPPWQPSTPCTLPLTSSAATSTVLSRVPNADLIGLPASARAPNRLASLPPTYASADQQLPPPPPSSAAFLSSSQPRPHALSSSSSAPTLELSRQEEGTVLRGLASSSSSSTAATGPASTGVHASHPAGASSAVLGLTKANGWMAAAVPSVAGGVGGATQSPTRPFHLHPLRNSNDNAQQQQQQRQPAPLSSTPPPSLAGLSRTSPAPVTATTTAAAAANGAASARAQSNPYFPQFPSTGNAAADAQLAQLYQAREAMRRQLQ